MPYTKKVYILLLVNVFLLQAAAQTRGIIQGKIIDSLQSPLESVSLKLLKLPDSAIISGTFSNKQGFFKFNNVEPGNYAVAAASVGFGSIVKTITLSGTQATPVMLTLVLLKGTQFLHEVEVTANSGYLSSKSGKMILNVDNSITAAGSTAFDVLRRAPGVVLGADGGIALRGREGVTVMIDGKPLNLSSADIVEMLKNTSTESIDKIELVTNPSSNYDASGSGGVINIKLKKSKGEGANGSLTIGGGYGENYKLNTSLLLNYKHKDFNIFSSLTVNDSKRADRYDLYRGVDLTRRNIGFNINNYDLKTLTNVSYKGGIDYLLSKSQSIGFMYTGMYNHMFSDEDNHTFVSTSGVPDSTIFTFSDEKRNVSNNSFNLNYTARLESKVSINADIDYLNYRRRSHEDLSYAFYKGSDLYRDSKGLENLTPSHITIRSAKVDVTKAFSDETFFQVGAKGSIVVNDNIREIENRGQDLWLSGSFVNDASQFKENIEAAYATYKTQFKRTSLELGLRGELTHSSGSSSSKSPSDRNYFNLFPTVNIAYTADSAHKIGLQYSRRINRPAYDDLNPFRYFLDQYTYREGNPYLRPEYSTLVELSDTYKEKLTTTLSYNYVKDYYLTFTDQDHDTGISRSIKRNLRDFKSVGLELNYAAVVKSWLNSNLNIQGYLREFDIGEDQPVKRNSRYLSASSVNTVRFKKGVSAQCTFNYESATVSGMYTFRPSYVLDLGVGKTFPKKNISLRFSVSDVLNSDRSRYSSDLWNASLTGEQKSETRVARINLTYKFGGKNPLASGRKTGDEESKRVSN